MASSTTPARGTSSSADHEEIDAGDKSDLSVLLDGHPLRETAGDLGDYLGVGVDAISLMMFVSRAAGTRYDHPALSIA